MCYTFHLVCRHSLDVREGFLGGSDKLGPALLQPSLVFILLVEPLVMAELLLADSPGS